MPISVTRKSNLDKVDARVKAAMKALVKETGEAVIKDIQQNMAQAKSGIQYKDLPRKSSAPGEAPAIQWGDVVQSYKVTPQGDLTILVGSDSAIAKMLENGTAHIAPRPALKPAIERARAKYKQNVREAVSAAIRQCAVR